MARSGTLHRDISPPPLRKASTVAKNAGKPEQPKKELEEHNDETHEKCAPGGKSDLAAIEAGEVEIRDHLEYFFHHLSSASRPAVGPRISFDAWRDLYKRSQHPHGRHFVVHQHDHPVSGVHYDLRLQISATSSISFAVPYGLPGNPNSQRPNRMAIETRVHNLWNHLIESASHATGSLLIWDTGQYEVLPRPRKRQKTTDDELSNDEASTKLDNLSQSELLHQAFQSRHIHLRLNGARLPLGYTIALRLPASNHTAAQPKKPARKWRRQHPSKAARKTSVVTDSDYDSGTVPSSPVAIDAEAEEEDLAAAIASEDDEDATIRANNAYTGATNSIGSVHQRHWFLTLDRTYSGFRKAGNGPDAGQWVGDWEAFYVRGRDVERSVVTGRNADEVMADENVEEFVGRKMWRPITE
ncbi:hypothetical protein CLAFUW4_05048 [Fulvia fulva]|uniref:DNA ligase D 3'-phosphoesterase domain-containing protein n=1 Tax=Passalora fulva TaxID=5499 RepID=A0A9Q8UU68_PASFU|nr:uncharacterized protein CLAFUR5_11859 [Fulvia fulva]KAK4626903.1 hypothetical protein CLAFUR4_05034 [Fulvia fulva]KAK4627615.1 hypothetical protein CLAFUR0_05038 [Fulvia fulva]UJO22585.1 hypothetical protein CLAFUR5_11859 [Fulvia fulva]WPV13616.1 hypothetical protein CLAFUW4_05048 [Fulvia fulva]WPV28375.1 hypothetical protein CLAFUW7_05042 [Fulvia fulva]